MKKILFIVLFPVLIFSAELKIGKSKMEYNLCQKWKIKSIDSTKGIKTCVYKREPIIDRNNIEVIPNIFTQLFKIHPDTNFNSHPDSILVDFDIMTRVLLLNNAPGEVMKEYIDSKSKDEKFNINFKPSYNFVSSYIDNFKVPHDCHYVTLMKPNKTGAFLIVDSTQETFKKIETEVQQFLDSIRLY